MEELVETSVEAGAAGGRLDQKNYSGKGASKCGWLKEVSQAQTRRKKRLRRLATFRGWMMIPFVGNSAS